MRIKKKRESESFRENERIKDKKRKQIARKKLSDQYNLLDIIEDSIDKEIENGKAENVQKTTNLMEDTTFNKDIFQGKILITFS